MVVDVDYIASKHQAPDEKLVENVETRVSEVEYHIVLEIVEEHKNGREKASVVLLFVIVRIVRDNEEYSISKKKKRRIQQEIRCL